MFQYDSKPLYDSLLHCFTGMWGKTEKNRSP